MTREQRRHEICEIMKLVDQVAVLSQYQIAKIHGIQVVLARLQNMSEQIEVVEGDGEGLSLDGEVARQGAGTEGGRPLDPLV
jgi:hypothetical protein